MMFTLELFANCTYTLTSLSISTLCFKISTNNPFKTRGMTELGLGSQSSSQIPPSRQHLAIAPNTSTLCPRRVARSQPRYLSYCMVPFLHQKPSRMKLGTFTFTDFLQTHHYFLVLPNYTQKTPPQELSGFLRGSRREAAECL